MHRGCARKWKTLVAGALLSLPAAAAPAAQPAPSSGKEEAPPPTPYQSCLDRFDGLRKPPLGYAGRSMIATLPDPLDSPYARELDLLFLALQQAMAQMGYVQDEACWTWKDGAATADRKPNEHRDEPSVVLFRRDRNGRSGRSPEVYAVVLVGELPHTGVHSGAMEKAIALTRPGGRLAPRGKAAGPIRILGPAFSGSARSLAVALLAGLGGDGGKVGVRLRSGTATAGDLGELFAELLGGGGRQVSFVSTGTSNDDFQRCVWNRLVPKRLGLRTRWEGNGTAVDDECAPATSGADNRRVALLVESSVYGRDFLDSGFEVVPFPTHIGALRDAYRELTKRQAAAAQAASPELEGTLPFEVRTASLQGVPVFGQQATLSSQDLALNRSLRQLARRRLQVIGIIATNTADKLFLAEKVRRFVPDARLVTFEGDQQLTHPQHLAVTAGMLVVSSNPLQEPPPLAEDVEGEMRLLFDFDGAHGVYRALIDLLGSAEREPARQVFASVVGKAGLVLLDRYEVGDAAGLPAASEKAAAGSGGDLVALGLVPTVARAPRMPVLWSLVLLLASLLLGLVAGVVMLDLRAGRPLLGLVPVDLVAPRHWRRLEERDRSLHAVVVVFPLTVGLLYFVLAVPALAPESPVASMEVAGLPASVLGLVASGVLLAVGIAGLYLFSGLLVRTLHDVRRASSGGSRGLLGRLAAPGTVLLPLGLVVVCGVAALVAAGLCIERLWHEGVPSALLVARTLSLTAGVSPLLPALLMAAVVLGWAILVLRCREVLPQGSPQRDLLPPADDEQAGRLVDGHRRLRREIDPVGDGRASFFWWLLLIGVPTFYLSALYGSRGLATPLRGIDGTSFDVGMSVLFLVILMLVVSVGVTLARGWVALRELAAAASGVVDLEGLGEVSRPPSLEPLRAALAKLAGRQPKATNALRRRVASGRGGTSAWLDATLWLRSADARAEGRAAVVAAARAYAAAGAAFAARRAFRHLRHLMAFLTFSMIALFFAVGSYPFEPRRVVLVYLAVLLVVAAALCSWVVVQARRDKLLVHLAGASETAGGWLPLAQRLSLFAGLPAVSLFAGRFPELRRLLGDWIEPLLNALH